MNTHRHAISKVCAVWLVILITLPFTAPFATCDLGGSSNSQPCDGGAKDKTGSDDKLAVVSIWSLVPPARDIVVARPCARPKSIEQAQPQYTILRV